MKNFMNSNDEFRFNEILFEKKSFFNYLSKNLIQVLFLFMVKYFFFLGKGAMTTKNGRNHLKRIQSTEKDHQNKYIKKPRGEHHQCPSLPPGDCHVLLVNN